MSGIEFRDGEESSELRSDWTCKFTVFETPDESRKVRIFFKVRSREGKCSPILTLTLRYRPIAGVTGFAGLRLVSEMGRALSRLREMVRQGLYGR